MRSRTLSRIAGALYVLVIALGLFGEVGVRDRVFVPSDAAATAANLRAMQSLWRVGIATEYVVLVCAIVILLILFVLLRPVSEELAWLAVFFNLVSIAVEAVAGLHLIEALLPGADPSLSIRAHGQGFGVALLFFGCFCVIAGYLMYASGYFPKAIGVLLEIAGFCYLANSFALILSPPLASRLFPAILIPSFIGESAVALWLLVSGVRQGKGSGDTIDP